MNERIIGIITDSFMKLLIPGLKVTIPLTLVSFVLSLVLGLALALAQTKKIPVLLQVSKFYIWIFRGTPLLVQLFIIFFGLPSLGIMINAIPAAILAFGLNLGAYNAEVFRAAILAVDKGQLEAAYMVGLTELQADFRIVLPQAFQIAFPSLFNNLISLLKDTSLASSITVIDMFTTAQQIAARTYEPFALYCEAALIYLVFSTALTKLQDYLEKKFTWTTKNKPGVKKAVISCL